MAHKQPKKMRFFVPLIFTLSSLVGFSGCSTISNFQSANDQAINQPNQIGSPEPSSTPKPSPSPEKPASGTVTPTPSDGEWDCSQVQNIDAKSDEGQAILDELVSLVQQLHQGDIISLVESWSISKLDHYIVVEALLTSSEPGIYVMKQDADEYHWLGSWGGGSTYEDQIAEYFTKAVPDAPKALFYCHGFSMWLVSTPSIVIGPTDPVVCAGVEHLDSNSNLAKILTAQLLKEYETSIHQGILEYDGDPYVDRMGEFFIVQANYKSQHPVIFVVKQTVRGFEIYGSTSTPNLDRKLTLLLLDEQISIHLDADEFPDELLTCLKIIDWISDD